MLSSMAKNSGKSSANAPIGSSGSEGNKSNTPPSEALSLPSFVAGSGSLDRLVETARDYARAAASENTLKAYAKDWAHFTRWCRMKGAEALPPSPELIGLYLADLASATGASPALSVSSIERRLSGMAWNFAQRGSTLDRKNRHIATVLAGIKRKHARPPVQKEAILAEDILAMVATLSFDLRGLRDRAILLIGFAGGLRRSEIVSLDHGKDDTPDSGGWVNILEAGAILTLRGKTGWREVEIARGSKDRTCPVHALEQWLHFARIDFGPVFVGTSRDGKRALEARLNDKHVARLIKRTIRDAGIRSELPEKDRLALFSGHSLRAGLASSAEVDERYVQKQLGHASAEMTRRYQRRRDRFRVNLTKAAGL
ncbi:phage integrase (plasmid) [Dinoroseobacter shibae DFL 12 = DSM 16493]|jgi:integrase|uniref:Phage integrase n=2 Tax=Alphaproteobacteria TaxID=28211 RepID=A8LTB4_DINSH|nr:tyrosine-type recombinase/integrase [Dinoroseobacter shibae]ABV95481.1 phage integrase [Dinoroseobacter shibae DFL 12 = DSM 16493]KMK64411.1 site-specific recombinase XerD [Puniceibacterium sp. IMCC21224]URF48670.1 tyrosine-type recombinase/integrase [Dinoroseobacter shibae]URF52982.1 tyrosine-type recombinase/integrase [Dinoroseobacter shibae]|tara:strand:+ start:20 stop:1129 length:1110 start_codon:yes stop_codon:yes gene_type:complete